MIRPFLVSEEVFITLAGIAVTGDHGKGLGLYFSGVRRTDPVISFGFGLGLVWGFFGNDRKFKRTLPVRYKYIKGL